MGEICSPDGLSRCWRGWRGYQETDTGTLSLNLHSTLLNINRNFACLDAEEVFEDVRGIGVGGQEEAWADGRGNEGEVREEYQVLTMGH